MAYSMDPSDPPFVTREEARLTAVKYSKGELSAYDLEMFKERFEVSLRNDPTLFDEVKSTILQELNSLKHLGKILETLDLVIWLIRLNLEPISDFWTENIEKIRRLKFRFTESNSWLDSIWWSKPKIVPIASLTRKISSIEMLLQDPEQDPAVREAIVNAISESPAANHSEDKHPAALRSPKCNLCRKKHCASESLILHNLVDCGHWLCEACLKHHCKSWLDKGLSAVSCPIDKTPIDRKLILGVLDEAQAQKYALIIQQNSEAKGGGRRQKVHCPYCSRPAFGEEFGLAECVFCDYAFCTNCLGTYHGWTECTQEDISTHTDLSGKSSKYGVTGHNTGSLLDLQAIEADAEDISKFGGAASIMAQKYPNTTNTTTAMIPKRQMQSQDHAYGAIAKPHEIEFYGANTGTAEDEFTAEDIAAAFQKIENFQVWPWDDEKYLIRSLTLDRFPTSFSTLNDGEWVEDVVLEEAMKKIVFRAEQVHHVAVLESYVMRWAIQKSYKDPTFCSMVREKHLLQKTVVAALINTELTGCGGHWMLGLIDIPNSRIILMDSSIVASTTFYQKYFFYLLHVLHVAYELERKLVPDWATWELILSQNAVQQENIIDCGPITVANFFAALRLEMLESTPKSHLLRHWIYEMVSVKAYDECVMELKTEGYSHAEDQIMIQPFQPTGLSFSYMDTTKHLTELGLIKSVNFSA